MKRESMLSTLSGLTLSLSLIGVPISTAFAQEGAPPTVPPAPTIGEGQGGMMPKPPEGMPMMSPEKMQKMMQKRRAMMMQRQETMQQHWAKMESHLANIEALLRELVELNKAKN